MTSAAVGVGTLVAALAFPASAVHGGASIGPRPPAGAAPARVGRDVAVHWLDGHERIGLDVLTARGCRPTVEAVTSTAPAREEVDLRLAGGAACRAPGRVRTVFLLPPPTVVDAGQSVKIYVDGRQAVLPPYAT